MLRITKFLFRKLILMPNLRTGIHQILKKVSAIAAQSYSRADFFNLQVLYTLSYIYDVYSKIDL